MSNTYAPTITVYDASGQPIIADAKISDEVLKAKGWTRENPKPVETAK